MRRPGNLLRKSLVILLAVGMIGGAAWGVWHWRAGGEKNVRYRTEKVQRGRVAFFINASGTVVPKEVVDVGAQVAGKIVDFGRDPNDSRKAIDYGTEVKKGTVLAVIDKSLYKADLDLATAGLMTAARDLEIAEKNVELAHKDVEKAEAELKASQAMATQASGDYDRAAKTARSGASTAEELAKLAATRV